MQTVKSAWEWWVRCWTAREHGSVLAAFRIVIGVIVVVDLTWHLTPGDIVHPLYTPIAEGGFAPASRFFNPILEMLGHSTSLAWVAIWTAILSGAAMALGIGGRFTAFVLLQALLLLHAIPEDIGGGYDRMLTNAVFILLLGSSTETWSLDCRLRTGRWVSDRPIYAFPRYLGIVQLAAIYTQAGLEKLHAPWFYPHSGVFRSLQQWSYVRFGEPWWLGHVYPVSQMSTVVTLIWESAFILTLVWWIARLGWIGVRPQHWAKRLDVRWPMLGVGLVMHLSLLVFMNLGTFSVISVAFYTLWVNPPASAGSR